MQLDIYLEESRLAIEAHGEQHYHSSHFIFGSSQKQQQRDALKREACREAGITLVEVEFIVYLSIYPS